MSWYLFEPERKPPFVAPDASDAGDFAYPFTIGCLVLGFALCIGGLVALLLGFKVLAGWGVAAGVALAVVAGLTMKVLRL